MFDDFSALRDRAVGYLGGVERICREAGSLLDAEEIAQRTRDLELCRFNIAIVGNMKRGKSTLINVLLGRRDDALAPVDNPVCTSAIVKYLPRAGNPSGNGAEGAKVYRYGDEKPLDIPLEDLRDYVSEKGNRENRRNVRSVEVYGDFPILHDAVVLVDTPGRGSIQRYHEDLLDQFLPMADAIILLVSADLPIEQSEKAFLGQLAEGERRRIFVVLTKRDTVKDGDMSAVRAFVRRNLDEAGLREVPRIHEVAAKRVFEALCAGAPEEDVASARRASGVEAFEGELERFILANSDTHRALIGKTASLLGRVRQTLEESRDRTRAELAARGKSIAEIEADQARLKEEGKRLRKELRRALDRFEKTFRKEIARFRAAVVAKSDVIVDRVTARLKGGLIAGLSESFQMRRLILRGAEPEWQLLGQVLNDRISRAVQQLQDDEELADAVECYRSLKFASDPISPAVAAATAGVGVAVAVEQGARVLTSVQAVLTAAGPTGLKGLWDWTWGGKAIATASSTKAIAATTAFGHFAIGWIAVFLAGKLVGLINPIMVAKKVPEVMEEAATKMVADLELVCANIREDVEDRVRERIEEMEDRMDSLKAEVARQDPELVKTLEARLARLDDCLRAGDELRRTLPMVAA